MPAACRPGSDEGGRAKEGPANGKLDDLAEQSEPGETIKDPPPQISLTQRERDIFGLLLSVLEKNGKSSTVLRVAGGWVRDKLRGLQSDDIDVAVSDLTGLELAEMVNAELQERGEEAHSVGLIRRNPERSKHLETACVRVFGIDIDLVNLRRETYTNSSRVPDTMTFGSPEEDANRRDFCVNALFYNLSTGEVEDFTGRGLADLHQRLIRTPLDCRETFRDDPLRALRAVRFCCKLGFHLDPEIREAMQDKELANRILIVSRQRYNKEIVEMLRWDAPRAVRMLWDLNLYQPVFLAPHREATGDDIFPTEADEAAHMQCVTSIVFAAWGNLEHLVDLACSQMGLPGSESGGKNSAAVPTMERSKCADDLAGLPAFVSPATKRTDGGGPGAHGNEGYTPSLPKLVEPLERPGHSSGNPSEPHADRCVQGVPPLVPGPLLISLARDLLVATPKSESVPFYNVTNRPQACIFLSLAAIVLSLPNRQYRVPPGLLDQNAVRTSKNAPVSVGKYVVRYCCAQSNALASRVEMVVALVRDAQKLPRLALEHLARSVHQSADPLVFLVACCFCPRYQDVLSHYLIKGASGFADFANAKPALDLASVARSFGVTDRRKFGAVKDAVLLSMLTSHDYVRLARSSEETRVWLARKEIRQFLAAELER